MRSGKLRIGGFSPICDSSAVCFSPLATNYFTALTRHLHSSQGLTPFKKGDFFKIFWEAWTQTFTEKLVLSSFEAVGIAPLNPTPNTNLSIYG